jgi:predicted O-methyltransferase YrrM
MAIVIKFNNKKMSKNNLIKIQFNQNKIGWKKSFLDGFSQDENGDALPWMTYPMIDFLKNNINKNHDIFEFGMGASTLFFSRLANSVTSLETNLQWFEIIKNKLTTNNSTQFLMPDALENSNYEEFAKKQNKKFDFIIIDSLKRFKCAQNSIPALKPGGCVILDDSERENYKKIFNFFSENNFKQQDFVGIEPGKLRVKNSTIFFPPH